MISKKFKAIYHGKTKGSRIRVNMLDGEATYPEFIAGDEKVVNANEASILQKREDFTVSEVVTAKK